MNDERTTAYLLNELPQHEAEQFEEECFSQPEWPEEELTAAEQDLIHAYLNNELGPKRRRRFEEHYLITEARKERVNSARAIEQFMCPRGQQKTKWTQKVLDFLKAMVFAPEYAVLRTAGIVLAIGLGTTSLWLTSRTSAPQTFAHINLTISTDNRSAGGSTQNIKLPLAADALRISLALPEPAPQGASYRVQWENVKGPIENLEIENQDANTVSVIIPAGKLTPGLYALRLFQKNPDGAEKRVPGSYIFNVD